MKITYKRSKKQKQQEAEEEAAAKKKHEQGETVELLAPTKSTQERKQEEAAKVLVPKNALTRACGDSTVNVIAIGHNVNKPIFATGNYSYRGEQIRFFSFNTLQQIGTEVTMHNKRACEALEFTKDDDRFLVALSSRAHDRITPEQLFCVIETKTGRVLYTVGATSCAPFNSFAIVNRMNSPCCSLRLFQNQQEQEEEGEEYNEDTEFMNDQGGFLVLTSFEQTFSCTEIPRRKLPSSSSLGSCTPYSSSTAGMVHSVSVSVSKNDERMRAIVLPSHLIKKTEKQQQQQSSSSSFPGIVTALAVNEKANLVAVAFTMNKKGGSVYAPSTSSRASGFLPETHITDPDMSSQVLVYSLTTSERLFPVKDLDILQASHVSAGEEIVGGPLRQDERERKREAERILKKKNKKKNNNNNKNNNNAKKKQEQEGEDEDDDCDEKEEKEETKRDVAVVAEHGDIINVLKFSDDGLMLASGGGREDCSVNVYSTSSSSSSSRSSSFMRKINKKPLELNGVILDICFVLNRFLLVSAEDAYGIRAYDISAHTSCRYVSKTWLPFPQKSCVYSIGVSLCNKVLVAAGDGEIALRSADDFLSPLKGMARKFLLKMKYLSKSEKIRELMDVFNCCVLLGRFIAS